MKEKSKFEIAAELSVQKYIQEVDGGIKLAEERGEIVQAPSLFEPGWLNTKESATVEVVSIDEYREQHPDEEKVCFCHNCGYKLQRGAVIDITGMQKLHLCEKCLSKLESFLRKGRKHNYQRWNYSVREYNGTISCRCFHNNMCESTKHLKIPLMDMIMCQDCYLLIYRTVRNYNLNHNEYCINYMAEHKMPIRKMRYTAQQEEKAYNEMRKARKILDERMLNQNRDATQNYVMGTKAKYLKNNETSFILMKDIIPVYCDKIGHSDTKTAKYFLKTNNPNIDFSLALCPNCSSNFKLVLEHPKYYFEGYGTTVWISKTHFQGSDHCLFCQCHEGTNYKIHFNNITFSCCDKHRQMLADTLTIR